MAGSVNVSYLYVTVSKISPSECVVVNFLKIKANILMADAKRHRPLKERKRMMPALTENDHPESVETIKCFILFSAGALFGIVIIVLKHNLSPSNSLRCTTYNRPESWKQSVGSS